MRKNHLLQIRVSEKEKEKISKIADMMGYGSISEYSRSRLLENQLLVVEKLNEIKKMLDDKDDTSKK